MEQVEAQTPTLPKIGDPAPQFTAKTTHGEISLSDFEGQWVVLFSHPADFTPVCSTEFMAFARKNDEFEKRDVKLIGLSVDSLPSHLAWVTNIKEKMGVEVPFPVIADLNTAVSQKYGMIHPGANETATVRTVFVIDPKQTIRAIIYYPLNVGRSIDEIIRLVDGLQTADKFSVAAPADWKPGEQVVEPAPASVEGVNQRLQGDLTGTDWYLKKKNLEG
ncbi:MAG: peroxiredoxin [Firmicutes bacterium]|uniref:Peroxiredoxin n=1 Tax=Melghirimyces thermohalophilus TaxID=1236220 RepID=A0A1G6N9K9_9BACL|nr:peroxiredoxin [Melghirimyces thermohalophilus]MDA8352084.1 peroxiredoxin [Bacillota bacterium]SDC64067.1 3-Cys thioredoxin peroxidase [Melghirimyces thermohalophilus]